MKSVLIRVTQSDIDLGCKFQPNSCAIARAIQRRLRHRFNANVTHSGISITVNGFRLGMIDTPTSASQFMVKFDGGEKTKPFDVLLSVPLAVYHAAFKQ